ncbi:MAG: hypothetical protein WC227_03590 [Patescibacteria group bacterium]|jgi:hypothetical protein
MTLKVKVPFMALGLVVFFQIWLWLSTILYISPKVQTLIICLAAIAIMLLALKMHYRADQPWGPFIDAACWGSILTVLLVGGVKGFALWTPWIKLIVSLPPSGNGAYAFY